MDPELGGHFAGDGCVVDAYSIKVQCTHPSVLLKYHGSFGGQLSQDSEGTFEWKVCGEEAKCCARRLVPYTLQKSRQLNVLLKEGGSAKTRTREIRRLRRFDITHEDLPSFEDSVCFYRVLAGFFAADGCIRVTNDSISPSYTIKLYQKFPVILEYIRDRTNPEQKIYLVRNKGKESMYHLHFGGDHARNLAKNILPYIPVDEKKEQVRLCLEMKDPVTTHELVTTLKWVRYTNHELFPVKQQEFNRKTNEETIESKVCRKCKQDTPKHLLGSYIRKRKNIPNYRYYETICKKCKYAR